MGGGGAGLAAFRPPSIRPLRHAGRAQETKHARALLDKAARLPRKLWIYLSEARLGTNQADELCSVPSTSSPPLRGLGKSGDGAQGAWRFEGSAGDDKWPTHPARRWEQNTPNACKLPCLSSPFRFCQLLLFGVSSTSGRYLCGGGFNEKGADLPERTHRQQIQLLPLHRTSQQPCSPQGCTRKRAREKISLNLKHTLLESCSDLPPPTHIHVRRVAPVMAHGALDIESHHGQIAERAAAGLPGALAAPGGRGSGWAGAPAAAAERVEPG